MPLPGLLPSLRDALQRRAAVFGPVEVDDAPTGLARAVSRRVGLLAAAAACGALACGPAALALAILRPADATLCAAEREIHEADAALTIILAADPAGDLTDAEASRLSRQWLDALQRMAGTPARAPAGMAAKARVVQRLTEQRDAEMVAVLAPSLAADVLRLGARA